MPTVNPITRLPCNCCWGARALHLREALGSACVCARVRFQGAQTTSEPHLVPIWSAHRRSAVQDDHRRTFSKCPEVLSQKTDTPQTAHWDLRGSVQVECQSARPQQDTKGGMSLSTGFKNTFEILFFCFILHLRYISEGNTAGFIYLLHRSRFLSKI